VILKGKRALVIGGSGGIGSAIAKALSENGAEILIASRSAKGAGSVSLDITDENSVAALAKKIEADWGGLDVLVNAAAITGPIGKVTEISPDDWRKTLDINLTGTFLAVRALAPLMKNRGRAKIINFVGGGDGPRPNFDAYVASKGGVARFTETAAAELKEWDIDVNAIAPGAVNTQLLEDVLSAGSGSSPEYEQAKKQKEAGGVSPEKAADLVVFLASPKSNGLTGKIFSAVWDKYEEFPGHRDEIMSSDIYNYRRIKPEDRGKRW